MKGNRGEDRWIEIQRKKEEDRARQRTSGKEKQLRKYKEMKRKNKKRERKSKKEKKWEKKWEKDKDSKRQKTEK